MPRTYGALNLVLGALSALLIAYIIRQLVMPTPLPVAGSRRPATAPANALMDVPRAPAGAYSVVAARNLFSPTRTESPTTTTTASSAPAVKPNLLGIVVRETGSIAYLEDPITKRVVGYRVGDKFVGGTVQTIKADAVVIERPDGPFDVRLRDPGRPRAVQTPGQPGAPPAGVAQPGAVPGAPLLPGVIPPASSPPQPTPPQAAQQPPSPQQPGQVPGVIPPNLQQPGTTPPGVRRPLPPNLLRRVPPGMSDAPQQ
jgi:hypothetical protein